MDVAKEVSETWESHLEDEPALHLAANVGVTSLMSNESVTRTPLLSIESVTQELFVRPQAPLLPCPAPVTPLPRQDEEKSVPEARRSARFINKPKMHTMDKAIQVLNSKMGVAREGVPLLQAREEYVEKYKTQLPTSTIDALAKLFKLNIRSMTEADEALIAMGGPGDSEVVVHDLVI
jgi:hypothetical protein